VRAWYSISGAGTTVETPPRRTSINRSYDAPATQSGATSDSKNWSPAGPISDRLRRQPRRDPCVADPNGSDSLALLDLYRESKDAAVREAIVARYIPLVHRLCNRFRNASEPYEDLVQVGILGLLNAIEKFDPGRGTDFSSLAIPEVLGAILNHLRDHGTHIKAPRKLRRHKVQVERASELLALRLERSPTVAELSHESGLSEGEVYATMELARIEYVRSLSDPVVDGPRGDAGTLSDFVGNEDDRLDLVLDRMVVLAALEGLPVRERRVITLRFYLGWTQMEVARRIGVSQMHVSRLERKALDRLRDLLGDAESGRRPPEDMPGQRASDLPTAS
jgi:RNA polymerase sigma-B factor